MKNIHVLPANKPSSLYSSGNFGISPQNIYITSDEEIKVGDWVLYTKGNKIHCQKLENKNDVELANIEDSGAFKIILTTDQDLIKDGVQSIDDEFLEWFVKNPSCEFVEVVDDWNSPRIDAYEYKIIIPKEEPKQETLEEVSEMHFEWTKDDETLTCKDHFISGAKWQQERICTSDFIQRIRATKSDAEARRIIREQFKNK